MPKQRFINAQVVVEYSIRSRVEDDDDRDPQDIAEELYAEGELGAIDNHEIKEAYIEEAMF